jgi:hypothetical protein
MSSKFAHADMHASAPLPSAARVCKRPHLLQKDLSSSLSSPSRTFLGGEWSVSYRRQHTQHMQDTAGQPLMQQGTQ